MTSSVGWVLSKNERKTIFSHQISAGINIYLTLTWFLTFMWLFLQWLLTSLIKAYFVQFISCYQKTKTSQIKNWIVVLSSYPRIHNVFIKFFLFFLKLWWAVVGCNYKQWQTHRKLSSPQISPTTAPNDKYDLLADFFGKKIIYSE